MIFLCSCPLWHFQNKNASLCLTLHPFLFSSSLPLLLPPALQCYCDRCSANSSCTTDGVCFVAIRKSGSRLTTEQRQCVHETDLIPRDRPFICAPSVKHDTGIYPMCCTTDYCNKEPNLEIIPGKNTRTIVLIYLSGPYIVWTSVFTYVYITYVLCILK